MFGKIKNQNNVGSVPKCSHEYSLCIFLLGWSRHREHKFCLLSQYLQTQHNLTPLANRLHFSVGGDTILRKRCLLSATSSSAFLLVVGRCQGMTLSYIPPPPRDCCVPQSVVFNHGEGFSPSS